MSFISVAAGQPIRATHVQQFTNWLTALKLDTPGTIACTSTSEYALTVRSQDGATGLSLAVQYGSASSPTTILRATKQGVAFAAGGTTTPALHSATDTSSGLYWPAASQTAMRANGVELLLNGASGASQRAVLYDTTSTTQIMQISRGGGVSDGSIPDSSLSAALAVNSYQSGGTAAAQGEAIKGSAYAASGTGGGFIGVSGIAEAPASSAWVASGSTTLMGLFGSAFSYKTSGRVWGANVIARGATAAQGSLTGIEVGVEAMSAVQDRYGVQIVTLASGTTFGSNEDIGLKFADKTNPTTTGNLWRVGIGFASSGIGTGTIGFPVSATGTLIKAFGGATVGDGIDLSSLTISGAVLKGPAVNISGIGRLRLGSTGVAGGTMFEINAVGDETYNMVFSNAITATSASDTATGPTLPTHAAEFMTIRFNGNTRKIPLYAS